MARTTIEDCLQHCPNHFDLAFFAARRARELRGDVARTEQLDDKETVVALREIAQGRIAIEPSEAVIEKRDDDGDANAETNAEA